MKAGRFLQKPKIIRLDGGERTQSFNEIWIV